MHHVLNLRSNILFLLLGLLMLGACTTEEAAPLRVGSSIWPGYEPLFLARELGYLDNSLVHLVEYTSATQVIRAFRNKAIEAAALTLDEVLLLNQYGINAKVVLVMDISNGADMILSQPDVKLLEDIRGRRVGVETGALGAFVLSQALDMVGLTPQDITIVPLAVSEHEHAFLEKEIDAVVTFEPVSSRLLEQGANQIFDSSMIPDQIVDVLVVSNDYLRKHPDAVEGLLKEWFRSLQYLANNPTAAAGHMVARLKLTPDEILNSYQRLTLPDEQRNMNLLSGPDPSLMQISRKLQVLMLSEHLLAQRGELSGLIDATPLQNILLDN